MQNDSYPLPNVPRKKPPAPIVRIAKDNPRPNETFTGTRQDWEMAIFRHAHHFTVFRLGAGKPGRRERITQTFDNYPAALAETKTNEQNILYAVTIEGTSFCVPQSDWGMYEQVWSEDNSA